MKYTIMSDTKEEMERTPIISGKKLLEMLDGGEKRKLHIRGFFERESVGKTRGGRSFSAHQFFLLGDEMTVTISVNSAGGKMLQHQIKDFKEKINDYLGFYESDVEFTHITKIKDKKTGQEKLVDFLSVRIIPESVTKKTFRPTEITYPNVEKEEKYLNAMESQSKYL